VNPNSNPSNTKKKKKKKKTKKTQKPPHTSGPWAYSLLTFLAPQPFYIALLMSCLPRISQVVHIVVFHLPGSLVNLLLIEPRVDLCAADHLLRQHWWAETQNRMVGNGRA
jgi:hypothetical protein